MCTERSISDSFHPLSWQFPIFLQNIPSPENFLSQKISTSESSLTGNNSPLDVFYWENPHSVGFNPLPLTPTNGKFPSVDALRRFALQDIFFILLNRNLILTRSKEQKMFASMILYWNSICVLNTDADFCYTFFYYTFKIKSLTVVTFIQSITCRNDSFFV